MKYRIGTLLLAAVFAGFMPAPAVLAQDAEQVQTLSNQIEGLEAAEQGGVIYLKCRRPSLKIDENTACLSNVKWNVD